MVWPSRPLTSAVTLGTCRDAGSAHHLKRAFKGRMTHADTDRLWCTAPGRLARETGGPCTPSSWSNRPGDACRWSPGRRPQVVHRVPSWPITTGRALSGPSRGSVGTLAPPQGCRQRPRRCRTASTGLANPICCSADPNEQCRFDRGVFARSEQGEDQRGVTVPALHRFTRPTRPSMAATSASRNGR